MRKRLMLMCFAIGSLLMTSGFLWKSGTVTQVADSFVAWHAERDAAAAYEEAMAEQKQTREKAWRVKCEALRALPVDSRTPLTFRGQQKKLSLELKTNAWSRKIVVPQDKPWSYYITVQPAKGHYLWFEDDREPIDLGASGESLGVRRGIFWLLGKMEGQTATVEIELKPLALKDVKSP